MRFLIFIALVASSVCLSRSWNEDDDFQPSRSWNEDNDYQPSHTRLETGSEYEYRYESQILTGLPTFSKQYAGMKVHCTLRIVVHSKQQDWMMLKMKDLKIFSLNKEILDVYALPPTGQLPLDLFTPLPSEQTRLITTKLKLPIKFRYKNGTVESMKILDKEETNWSLDMKRSILSILQVRLQPEDSKQTKRLELYNSLAKHNETTFDVIESGLEGTCYSTIHAYSDDTDDSDIAKWYKVTKVRDQMNCKKMNTKEKTVYQQHQSNCDCRRNMDSKVCQCAPVSSSWNSTTYGSNNARTVYDIVSEDGGKTFLIKKAVQSVEHRIEDPQAPNKFLLTTANQTLVMTAQRSSVPSNDLEDLPWTSIYQPWKIQILEAEEERLMMSKEEIGKNILDQLQQIEEASSQPKRFDDHLLLFYSVLTNVRLCKKEQLKYLFSDLRREGPNNRKLKVFIDVLKATNTTAADTFLLSEIGSNGGSIQDLDAISVFMQWAAEKVPTVTVLNEMHSTVLEFLRKRPAKKMVYSHAMLCFGSMVRRYIHNEEIKLDQCVLTVDKAFHQRNIDYCRKYEKYIEFRLRDAKTEEEKVMALKTMANLGSILSLTSLQKYLANTESNAVRVQAINAFTNLGFQNRKKVLQSLMPIVLNNWEESELRVAAFVMVMKCSPRRPLMELQHLLNDEKDLEFKTFVVKYLKNMLEADDPRCRESQMRIRQTLKGVRAFQMSQQTIDWQMKYGIKDSGDMIRISRVAEATSATAIPSFASFQQYSVLNKQLNHLYEFGFRAEGMKESMKSKLEQPQRKLNPSVGNQKKPSLTFYAKVLGQEVSFAHLDESKLGAIYSLVGPKGGAVELPVDIFTTILLNPRKKRVLLPSGVWSGNDYSHVIVVDLKGAVKVEMTSDSTLPIITFTFTQKQRLQVQTVSTSFIDMGFAVTGITSSMSAVGYTNSEKTLTSYDLENGNFIRSSINPSSDLFDLREFKALTQTFVLPTRLPINSNSLSAVLKELKVDESQRKKFSQDVDALRSIDLEGKIEGDVNMPELYTFIRDRFHVLPTCLSTYKQHLKLTVRAAKTSVRTISLRLSSRFLNPTEAEVREIERLKAESETSQKEDGVLDTLMGWFNKDSHLEREDSLTQDRSLRAPSLGTLCHTYSFSLATISDDQSILNMTADWMTYYEHDHPTTSSLLRVARPPIREEKEQQQFVNKISNILNPGTSEILQSHRISWGPVSAPHRQTINATLKLRPNYKDNVCYEHTAYGCKDDYGVIYPIWYNNTLHVESRNNNVTARIRDSLESYLINQAESVYMVLNSSPMSLSEDTIDLDFITRPIENKIDIIVKDTQMVMNLSRISAPVFTKLHQQVTEYKHLLNGDALDSLDIGFLPVHVNTKYRESCIYSYPRVKTLDNKELSLPKTDCEIVLAGNCDSEDKKLQVTVVPVSDLSAPKELRISIGNKKIQMSWKRQSRWNKWEMEVRIDDLVQKVQAFQRLPIRDQGKTVATLECGESKCEVLCPQHGVYINMNRERVSFMVDPAKSKYACGLCAARSGLPQKPSVKRCMDIANENIISTERCSVDEMVTLSGKRGNRCDNLEKYRLINDVDRKNGVWMTCVSEMTHPICSGRCARRSRQMLVKAKCVSGPEANKIGLLPMAQGGELIVENREVIEAVMKSGKEKYVLIQTYKCR